MKESIFFSCLAILIVFQGFYLIINPEAIWTFGIATLLGFIYTGLLIGILSGITALTVGIGETSVRIIFITVSVLNLMFQFKLNFWIGYPYGYHVISPVGMGILYPTAWNIFVVEGGGGFLGYIGFVFITTIAVLMLVCAMLMGAGVHE